MRNGKYSKRRGVTSKTLVLALVLMMVVGATIGGTIAWLTDTSDKVVNTFTDSDIEITLTESDTDPNTAGEQHDYKMVPGYTITKDPKVTVETGSEKCYLFVKLEKANNFDSFLTYDIADGWTPLDGVDNVYYRVVDATTTDTSFSVLKGDKVTVLGSVTKSMMDELRDGKAEKPTLTVTAYASQFYKSAGVEFDVNTAWTNISTPSGT